MALHEVTWCMVVWCTQNLRRDGSCFMWYCTSHNSTVSTPLQWIFKNSDMSEMCANWSFMQQDWFVVFIVKVTLRAQNVTFVLYFLNYWFFCIQTEFDGPSSKVLCVLWKDCIAVLRSSPQQRLKMSVNVYLDSTFWTTVLFVTRLGIILSQSVQQKDGLL